MLNPRTLLPLFAVIVLVVLPASAQAAASRTWVSGVGDDVNPCSRTAPCKTFAGAISKTADVGEIDALDPGGFGGVTVTKSMTIDGGGMLAGVLIAGTNGIVINGAGDDVVLRNLTIHGTGASDPLPDPHPACRASALSGVRIINARSVRIEHVTIDAMVTAGISIASGAGVATDVSLEGVDISNVCGPGILAAPVAGGTVRLNVRNTSMTNVGTGIDVGAGVSATVADTTIFGSTGGVSAHDGGTAIDFGRNMLVANATQGAFTGTGGDVPAAAPITVNPTPVTVNPTPSVVTTVNTPVPLVIALADASVGGVSGKAVALQFAATAPGTAELEVRRAGAVVAQVDTKARKGSNTVAWNGKVAGKAAPAGVYVLTLRVEGVDAQVASALASAKVTKPVAAKVLVSRRARH